MIGSFIKAFNADGEFITGIVVKEFENTCLAFMIEGEGSMYFLEVPKEGANVIRHVVEDPLEEIREGIERVKKMSQK